jgi:hypothetical protein
MTYWCTFRHHCRYVSSLLSCISSVIGIPTAVQAEPKGIRFLNYMFYRSDIRKPVIELRMPCAWSWHARVIGPDGDGRWWEYLLKDEHIEQMTGFS